MTGLEPFCTPNGLLRWGLEASPRASETPTFLLGPTGCLQDRFWKPPGPLRAAFWTLFGHQNGSKIRRSLQASSVRDRQKDRMDYYNILSTTHYLRSASLPCYHTHNLATFQPETQLSYGTTMLPFLRPKFLVPIPEWHHRSLRERTLPDLRPRSPSRTPDP